MTANRDPLAQIKLMPKKLLYVITQSPYSSVAGQEALDAVLIGTAFEQEVSVLLLHDGVFQCKRNQQASQAKLKVYTKTFGALSDYGVDKIYVLKSSLFARGLRQEDLIIDTVLLNDQEVSDLIKQQFRVFTF